MINTLECLHIFWIFPLLATSFLLYMLWSLTSTSDITFEINFLELHSTLSEKMLFLKWIHSNNNHHPNYLQTKSTKHAKSFLLIFPKQKHKASIHNKKATQLTKRCTALDQGYLSIKLASYF